MNSGSGSLWRSVAIPLPRERAIGAQAGTHRALAYRIGVNYVIYAMTH